MRIETSHSATPRAIEKQREKILRKYWIPWTQPPEKHTHLKSVALTKNKATLKTTSDFIWKAIHGTLCWKVVDTNTRMWRKSLMPNLWGHQISRTHPIPLQSHRTERGVGTCNEGMAENEVEMAWPLLGHSVRYTEEYSRNSRCKDAAGKGKPKNSRQRLYTIMMSEAVCLIWLLRNERCIQNKDSPEFTHSKEKITNRWYDRLNTRLMQISEHLLSDDWIICQERL